MTLSELFPQDNVTGLDVAATVTSIDTKPRKAIRLASLAFHELRHTNASRFIHARCSNAGGGAVCFAQVLRCTLHFREGSKADETAAIFDVCFYPDNDRIADVSGCPLL